MARPRAHEAEPEPFVYVNVRTGIAQLRKSALRLLADVVSGRLVVVAAGNVVTVRAAELERGEVCIRWDPLRRRLFVGDLECMDHNVAVLQAEHLASMNAEEARRPSSALKPPAPKAEVNVGF